MKNLLFLKVFAVTTILVMSSASVQAQDWPGPGHPGPHRSMMAEEINNDFDSMNQKVQKNEVGTNSFEDSMLTGLIIFPSLAAYSWRHRVHPKKN